MAPSDEDFAPWQTRMDVLVAGAFRGMIEAQREFAVQAGAEPLPPRLSEMFDALLVFAATLLEDSPRYPDEFSMEHAADEVRRILLHYLGIFRNERLAYGEGAMDRLLTRVGLAREQLH